MNERREPTISRPQDRVQQKQGNFNIPPSAAAPQVPSPTAVPQFLIDREAREQMQPLPQPPIEDVARKGMDALSMLVGERDRLRADCEHWHSTAVRLNERVDHLETELAYFKSRSEHFERFSMSMTTQISNLEMLINDIKNRARSAAFNGDQRPLTPKEEDALRALGQKLGADNRQEDGS